MIVGFPFLSWYYLTGGIDYRKTALKELESKEKFNLDELLDTAHHSMVGELLLVDFGGSSDSFDKLYSQFDKAPDFNMLSLNSKNQNNLLSIDEVNKLKVYFTGSSYILVDSDGMVRRKYVDSSDDMQLLVKHIATLLPVNEKKKIKK